MTNLDKTEPTLDQVLDRVDWRGMPMACLTFEERSLYRRYRLRIALSSAALWLVLWAVFLCLFPMGASALVFWSWLGFLPLLEPLLARYGREPNS